MATLAAIATRRMNATTRIGEALGIKFAPTPNGIPFHMEYREAQHLEQIAEALEAKEPDDQQPAA